MSRLFAVLIVLFTFAAVVFAQNTATISGQTLDPSGTAVPDVAITLTNLATHNVSQAASDSGGNYTLSSPCTRLLQPKGFQGGF